MRSRSRILVTLAIVALASNVHAAAPKEFEPLSFLLGTWQGQGDGRPGSGGGTTVFQADLQDRVIVRTNFAEYPASEGRPASRHDDLMILYAAAGGLRADYYDNEGHVIRYAITANAGHDAVFVSDVAAGAPRFRLTYTLTEAGVIAGKFEIAPPGQPDAFAPYLNWTMKRTGSR